MSRHLAGARQTRLYRRAHGGQTRRCKGRICLAPARSTGRWRGPSSCLGTWREPGKRGRPDARTAARRDGARAVFAWLPPGPQGVGVARRHVSAPGGSQANAAVQTRTRRPNETVQGPCLPGSRQVHSTLVVPVVMSRHLAGARQTRLYTRSFGRCRHDAGALLPRSHQLVPGQSRCRVRLRRRPRAPHARQHFTPCSLHPSPLSPRCKKSFPDSKRSYRTSRPRPAASRPNFGQASVT